MTGTKLVLTWGAEAEDVGEAFVEIAWYPEVTADKVPLATTR
jgi:hypothetical protein